MLGPIQEKYEGLISVPPGLSNYDTMSSMISARGLPETAEHVPELEKPLYAQAALKLLRARDQKFCTFSLHFPTPIWTILSHWESIFFLVFSNPPLAPSYILPLAPTARRGTPAAVL